MRLIASNMNPNAATERCSCCGLLIRARDRVFYVNPKQDRWCSPKCFENSKKLVAIHSN